VLDNLVVGDTLNFTTSVPGYPADEGWTLHFRLIPRVSGSAIEVTGASDDDDPSLHRIEVAASVTAAWTAGVYSWASWVSKALESYSLSKGAVTLLPDPRVSTAPLDLRTEAEIALDDAETALATWTPSAMTRSYTIGSRSMTFSTRDEIKGTIDHWKAKVQRERRAARLAKGLPDPSKTFVGLGRV
jgi:hypothetical protein